MMEIDERAIFFHAGRVFSIWKYTIIYSSKVIGKIKVLTYSLGILLELEILSSGPMPRYYIK